MALPRPRITLFTLMILVALVAIVFGMETMRRRREFHRERATVFAREERDALKDAMRYEKAAKQWIQGAEKYEAWADNPRLRSLREGNLRGARQERELAQMEDEDAREARKRAEDAGRIRRRHEYAASHPWLRVDVEPLFER